MPTRPVTFSHESALRIAAAVRKVERTPQSLAGDRNPSHDKGTSFWAYLLSSDTSGQFFSWLRLVPAAKLPNAIDPFAPLEQDRPLFELDQPTMFSEWTAREANGHKNVPMGSVVQLTFIGFDSKDEPVYVFTWNPPLDDPLDLPIHDHRDNITGGGFAFAVYHPGTALPQQPWHL